MRVIGGFYVWGLLVTLSWRVMPLTERKLEKDWVGKAKEAMEVSHKGTADLWWLRVQTQENRHTGVPEGP